ncbi:MAG: hypothetical protein RLZZ297_1800 [Chloroflexota bacterium]|jgi:alpha-tubulin suppressor-like RCC1 family protein
MVAEVAGAQGRLADEATLDAGEAHTCLLTAVGGVKCWGANTDGQLGTGDTTPSNVVRDVVGLASGVTQLSVGGSHSCAIDAAQQVTCWGMNDHGQVGDGTTTTRSAPVAVVGIDTTILAVSAGQRHTCVLARSGVISCWGSNADGELGLGYASASMCERPLRWMRHRNRLSVCPPEPVSPVQLAHRGTLTVGVPTKQGNWVTGQRRRGHDRFSSAG